MHKIKIFECFEQWNEKKQKSKYVNVLLNDVLWSE